MRATPLLPLPIAMQLVACDLFTEVPRSYSSAGNATILFRDDFSAPTLGPAWHPTGPGATIVDGALVLENLHNHPLWLTLPLPDDVRIEFDALAHSDEGDIKVELAGDGKSYARAASYKATGYVMIFGGWNNSVNALVRRDEHGNDKRTTNAPKVDPNRRYHIVLTRQDGLLTWELDGQELLRYDDPDPLQGPGQQHFAFGGWEAKVRFDNLVIAALADPT